jgi:hypothetical protein
MDTGLRMGGRDQGSSGENVVASNIPGVTLFLRNLK